ncbi:hypothetical protein B0H14DRAFT_3160762 [Mycena olivaceomarginata]|nr:hypothetical protein B0H14DRAFT_3160762 [Mycena olivaceomarginata]
MISSTKLIDPLSPQSPAPSYSAKSQSRPHHLLPSSPSRLRLFSLVLLDHCGHMPLQRRCFLSPFVNQFPPPLPRPSPPCKEDFPYHLLATYFLPCHQDRRHKRWHPKALMLDSPCKEDVPYHLLLTNFLSRPETVAVSGGIPKPGWQGQFWLLKLGELEHELRTES